MAAVNVAAWHAAYSDVLRPEFMAFNYPAVLLGSEESLPDLPPHASHRIRSAPYLLHNQTACRNPCGGGRFGAAPARRRGCGARLVGRRSADLRHRGGQGPSGPPRRRRLRTRTAPPSRRQSAAPRSRRPPAGSLVTESRWDSGSSVIDALLYFTSWFDRHAPSVSATIAGGTSEIHRNIIVQRVLGLPQR
jgi:hypothetical protein